MLYTNRQISCSFFMRYPPILIKLERQSKRGVIDLQGYSLGHVVTFATDSKDIYAVYVPNDAWEFLYALKRAAPRPHMLVPMDAGQILSKQYKVYVESVPKSGKIPDNFVTRENVREVLLSRFEPQMLVDETALELVATHSTNKLLLCDERGELCVKNYCATYCRIGGRYYVGFTSGKWYELPRELYSMLNYAELTPRKRCDPAQFDNLDREVDHEEFAKKMAERFGITGEYLGETNPAYYRHGAVEGTLCGYVEKFDVYDAYVYGKGRRYGKLNVICIREERFVLEYENESVYLKWDPRRRCFAWWAGYPDASAPPDIITYCVESGQCPPAIVSQLPDPVREQVLSHLAEWLKRYHGDDPGNYVRRFPIEAIQRAFGVATYEEAEAKLRQLIAEREERRVPCDPGADRVKKIVEAEDALAGLPIRVTVGKYVYARPTRDLSAEEQQMAEEVLKKLGFRYIEKWSAWVYAPCRSE